MKKSLLIASLSLALSLNALPFDIDSSHSNIDFKVKHLIVSNVGGSFKTFSGKVDIDPKNKKINTLEGEIAIASIDTGNKTRDDHLKAPDFFNEKKNPKGYFKFKDQKGNKIYGTLTLAGVSKEIAFDADISDAIPHPQTKKPVMAIELKGQINRKDFGIGTSTSDNMVSDEVKIIINLELKGR